MSRHKKGSRRERELVNSLDGEGFAVMRAPASGSSTDREQPDVQAGNLKAIYAIEGKSSADDTIYIDGEEVEKLLVYSTSMGARIRLGVRFDREDWYFLHPAEADFTRGGNYKITLEMAKEKGQKIDDLKAGVPCKPRNTASA